MFRRTFAVVLSLALALPAGFASAAPASEPPTPESPASASALAAKVRAAFERGEPVERALASGEPAAGAKAAASDVPRDFAARVARVREFQEVRPPAVPSCPKTPKPADDPNGCVMEAARAAASALGIAGPRADAAAALYLARYVGPQNQSPAERRAAEKRAAAALSDGRFSASTTRIRAVMGQAGRLGAAEFAGGGAGGGVPAGPGGRSVAQAIAEARRAGEPRGSMKASIDVPSLSQKLGESAAEDARILELGKDDGTWSTAVGRSATQVKKGATAFAAWLVDGGTWKRTGAAAADLASHPGDAVRNLPGGLAAGAGALWRGVKSDIRVASGELSEFIEHPTPYRGIAVVGATAAAVSNAFVGVGSGAETAARQAAKAGIRDGVSSAEHYAARLGAGMDDLDFTGHTASVGDEIRGKYKSFTAAGRAEDAAAPTGLQGRIGVSEDRFSKIDELKRQRNQDCARYGIASCAIGNGHDLSLEKVKDTSAEVLVDNARSEVSRLEALKRAGGGDAAGVEAKLVAARHRLTNMEFFPSTSGLGVGDISATLDRLSVPHRSLGFDNRALSSVKAGDAEAFRASAAGMRRSIDLELSKGNAVMAAIYTGMKEGGHTQHAITVLGKGRAADGAIVYQVFDSNVGRVSLMPASDLNVYGGVVVGKL